MSDTADPIKSEETQEAPGPEMSSPPSPDPYPGQEPPPYSEVPEMYFPSKTEATCTDQPGTGNEAFQETNPEAETNPDAEAATFSAPSAFEDEAVRKGFVRKVFCILTLQLVFTFSVVCVFTFSSVVKEEVQSNIWIYVSSIIIFAVVLVSLSLCPSFNRRHPWNIVGLVVVTVSISYMVGTVASFYDTASVIITMGATLAISVTVIAFSAQTRFDFSFCYGFLLVMVVDLIMFGFFSIFYYSYMSDVAYGCLGALLFSMFLMIDCQLMMGTMSYRLSPEEYVTAALTIYLDIILIFLYLLGRR